jgi:signal transduction histidine kinase/CheY-like chemotaxis protein
MIGNYTKKKSGSLLTAFNSDRQHIIQRALTQGSLLCAMLVPLFTILDSFMKPHLFSTLLLIRIITSIICVLIYFASRHQHGKRFAYILTLIIAMTVCGSISLMCHIDQGPQDPYYAGMNLPLLGLGIMFPLTLLEVLIIFIPIWLSYLIPGIIAVHSYEMPIFISNLFFFTSTMIISVAGTQFNLRYRIDQWNINRRLRSAHSRIKSHADDLEKIVKERTQKLIQSERLAVVGQLAGGIAHDFNNTLTAVLGTCQLAMETAEKDSSIYSDLESIYKASQRAVGLIKQLLAFSRKQIMQPKIININDVINDTSKILRRLIGENIELEIELSENIGNIKADPVQMEQIILNLAVNARDAMPDGGKLTIKTSGAFLDESYLTLGKLSLCQGDYVLLTIVDTGIGMDEEIKNKIFEPFFTTKEKGYGTGLGLSSAYGIIRQSQGDIIAYSEKGHGSSFKIYLPIIKQEKHRIIEKLEKSLIPKGNETILLVEDEESVRKLTARILQRQGYHVMQAEEGKSALAMAKIYEGKIDMLLTDMVMPYVNGFDLAKDLRKLRSDIKILFISGHIDGLIDQKAASFANSAFLQKPYTLESLSVKIRSILDN